MTHTAIYVARQHNPWFNLATESWLIEKQELRDTHVLYLWRNSPCIVIGRYQNPWVECNLQAMERDGILLARRLSGGGAVYQDLGNTCFTIISPREQYDKGRNFDIVRKALATCGVTSELSGRNDILVDGRKVSGSAFQLTATRGCHHGTLLIDANLSHIGDYLTPDKQKLEAKGIRSVASRVVNLREIEPSFTHDRFSDAVIEAFRAEYGEEAPVQGLDTAMLEREPLLMETYEKLSADAWRFGTTPQFGHTCSERLPWGRLTFHLDVEKGMIVQVKVFSDALSTDCVELLEQSLPGLPYTVKAVRERVEEVADGLPQELAALVREGAGVLVRDME
ncbi:MAG: lipoate--protein ligase [Sphaerochaetaceae bacterium]|nr:lipoate--protein ligase [Sphaerochaetaceae bacterium]